MKIRNGFVSNSSSSSFIIDGNKYTCVDIALIMIDVLKNDIDKEDYEKIKRNLEKLEDKNTSIFIECSDDIHIVKKGDKIYVEGSHHYYWKLNYLKQGDEGEYRDIIYEGKFYFPLYDNKYLGKIAVADYPQYKNKWIYSCNECKCRFLELDDGSVFCPNCLHDPDGKPNQKIFRKNKLKRILK